MYEYVLASSIMARCTLLHVGVRQSHCPARVPRSDTVTSRSSPSPAPSPHPRVRTRLLVSLLLLLFLTFRHQHYSQSRVTRRARTLTTTAAQHSTAQSVSHLHESSSPATAIEDSTFSALLLQATTTTTSLTLPPTLFEQLHPYRCPSHKQHHVVRLGTRTRPAPCAHYPGTSPGRTRKDRSRRSGRCR